jgi:hypothetical protein
MQSFKRKEWHQLKKAQEWWGLGARNMPLVTEQLKKDPELLKSSLELHRSLEGMLQHPKEKIPQAFWKETLNILQQVLKENRHLRKPRKDLSRAIDMAGVLQGKSFEEALHILNKVSPARHPGTTGAEKKKFSKKEFSGKAS